MPARLQVTFAQAIRYAKVDGWQLARWMGKGEVDWAYDAAGVVTISLESLQAMTAGPVRSSVLQEARVHG